MIPDGWVSFDRRGRPIGFVWNDGVNQPKGRSPVVLLKVTDLVEPSKKTAIKRLTSGQMEDFENYQLPLILNLLKRLAHSDIALMFEAYIKTLKSQGSADYCQGLTQAGDEE